MSLAAVDLVPRSVVVRSLAQEPAARLDLYSALEALRVLARQESALVFRTAMVLAWLKRRDLADLGYPSFTSFCVEKVDWKPTWVRLLVRLVESPLDAVKRATWHGALPLRHAVRAPGEVDEDGEIVWLLRALRGELDRLEPQPLDTYEGEDAIVIRRARHLARLLIGREATDREVDAFILRCWRDEVSAEKLLADARAVTPAPSADPLRWDWCEGEDPLLESWVEPVSLQDALSRLEVLQAAMRGRRVVLARAWFVLHDAQAWVAAGYPTAEAFANDIFGVSLRTAQRMARVGRALDRWPELAQAAQEGLPFGVLDQLSRVVDRRTASCWVEVAARVGRLELSRAVKDAREGSPRQTLGRYQRAIPAADRFARSRPQTTSAAPLKVAVPHPEPEPPSAAPLRAPPDLPRAARWLLERVQIPAKRGFAAVKDRDDHRCTNPECGRRSLRNEAHHVVWRIHGGSDEPGNGTTVCRSCHLRLLHTGRLTLERVRVDGADALLWGYPGGRYVLSFREEPGVVQ